MNFDGGDPGQRNRHRSRLSTNGYYACNFAAGSSAGRKRMGMAALQRAPRGFYRRPAASTGRTDVEELTVARGGGSAEGRCA